MSESTGLDQNLNILVINPGSLSTRLSLFKDEIPVWEEELQHPPEELARFSELLEQFPMRLAAIDSVLENRALDPTDLQAVAVRGAPLKPLSGGTYLVQGKLLEDLREGRVSTPHISMLAALLGAAVAKRAAIPVFMTDPISVDEMIPEARLSGLPELPRRSHWHALNCRAMARYAAQELGLRFDQANLIVAHLGGGITVAALLKGRAIDVTDANSEAPFSPQRCGTLPMVGLIKLCFAGTHNARSLLHLITRTGGLTAHLGTHDALEVESRIEAGDESARLVYSAMAYQVAKAIGAMAAALEGKVDAVVLTGGLARSQLLVNWIKARVSFIARVLVYPGQEEMAALAEGALRILRGEEKPGEYGA